MGYPPFGRRPHSGNLSANTEKGNSNYHEPRPCFRMVGAFYLWAWPVEDGGVRNKKPPAIPLHFPLFNQEKFHFLLINYVYEFM